MLILTTYDNDGNLYVGILHSYPIHADTPYSTLPVVSRFLYLVQPLLYDRHLTGTLCVYDV